MTCDCIWGWEWGAAHQERIWLTMERKNINEDKLGNQSCPVDRNILQLFIGFAAVIILSSFQQKKHDFVELSQKQSCKTVNYTICTPVRGLVYLPQLRQSLLETKHQLGFLNELQSPWFSYSKLPAATVLGFEPGASNDFSQSFMIGLLPWDLDQEDEKWAQDYLETVHI